MMGIPRRITATVLASFLVSATVAAQPSPTPAQKQQAGDLTKQAIAMSQAGEHEDAVRLYLEAYAIVPLPVLLSNVGAEYQKLEQPVDALKYFCMYLEKDPTGQSATYATAQAKTLRIELGQNVESDADVCKPPEKVVEPPPPDPDPELTAVTPAAAAPADGGGSSLRPIGIGVAGAGVVALGAGVFFGLKAKSVSDDITNHPMNEQWPEDIRALEEQGQAHENKQIIFMIAGGALVATGAVLFVLGGSKPQRAEQVTVTPVATPDSMGFAVSGGF